ncbi:MAG: hypothetical protein L6R37_006161 [Teloschistes peruensis]|nr:MAG: hypothetical protein L6R37_006161 [Teloschistes peruensis]
MHGLVSLVLLLIPLVNARPQGIGVVICDSTAVTQFSYKTDSSEDVTEQSGDKGWENYDAQTCTSYGEPCNRQEGNEVTKEISVSFGVGGSFDLAEAVDAGLDFGVSVAYSTTKTEATSQPCEPSEDPNKPCVCGLQSKAFMQRAKGTRHSTNACGKKVQEAFDVTAPIKKGDQPWVQWRSCRSSLSECPNMAEFPLCADGV